LSPTISCSARHVRKTSRSSSTVTTRCFVSGSENAPLRRQMRVSRHPVGPRRDLSCFDCSICPLSTQPHSNSATGLRFMPSNPRKTQFKPKDFTFSNVFHRRLSTISGDTLGIALCRSSFRTTHTSVASACLKFRRKFHQRSNKLEEFSECRTASFQCQLYRVLTHAAIVPTDRLVPTALPVRPSSWPPNGPARTAHR
jgi:hypothetical protein